MAGSSLDAKIAKRLDAWVDVQRHIKQEGLKVAGKTITISREFGCEAYPLAEKVYNLVEKQTGKKLHIFDRKIFELACGDDGISKEMLEKYDSPARHLDLLSPFFSNWKTGNDLYEILAKKMLELAEHGNCIIIGRGAAVLTQELTNCFHFRLEAPANYRIESLMRRNSMSIEDATKLVKDNESQREKFLKNFLNCSNIDNIKYYNMKFNNAKTSLDEMSKIIASYIIP